MRLYILSICLMCSTLHAQISPSLKQKMSLDQTIPVLIQLNTQAQFPEWKQHWTKTQKAEYISNTLFEHASKSQSDLRSYLNVQGINHRNYYLVNAIWAELSPEQINVLASRPEVQQISYDSPQAADLPAQDLSPQLHSRAPEVTWGIQRIGADKVWKLGYKGQGVVVGGNDTGVKWDIAALKQQYRGYAPGDIDHNYNWHDAIHAISPLNANGDNPCGLNTKEPCDDHSHGTHTVGTMIGLTNEQAIGVAPEAQWIACRNMERGSGAPSTYLECFEFFLAPYDLNGKNKKPEMAPHVINNSWFCSLEEGCDTSTFPIMEIAVENLKKSGVFVTVSAGNDGAACGTLKNVPAIYEASFTVGATSSEDKISSFSCNGPVTNYKDTRIKPNVVAPGSDVLSVLPDETYASWSGTSMAGPHVAGLVALMISANPALAGQVEQLEDIIEETASHWVADFDCWPSNGSDLPNNTFGYGLINAEQAIKKAILYIGNNNLEPVELKLYPNPAYGKINIEQKEFYSGEWILRDIFGRVLLQRENQEKNFSIDLTGLRPGFYFLCNKNTISQLFSIVE